MIGKRIPFSSSWKLAIAKRHRIGAGLPQRTQAERVMPFRETFTAFVADQLAVIKRRRVPTKRPIKQKLSRRGDEQIRAPHHLRDLHRMIVNHTGQLVGGQIIVPPQNEIAEIAPATVFLWTETTINAINALPVRNTKPPAKLSSSRKFLDTFRSAGAGIHWFIISRMRRLQCAQHILPGTSAWINQPRCSQSLELSPVNFNPLALIIRRVRATNIRPFIPIATEPFQIFNKRGHKFRPRAGTIQILVAQNQRPARRTGALPRDPERARMAEMQKPRRRRRKPSAISWGMEIFRSDAE